MQGASSTGFLTSLSVPLSSSRTHARLDTKSDDEEWHGIASAPSNEAGLEQEAAYSDEEQLATVTIVEDFDPSTLIHGPASSDPQAESSPSPSRRVSQNGGERTRDVGGGKGTSKRKNATTTTTTKKKVRYETKAARRATQAKQRARRMEKAELAGGKAARKTTKAGRKKRR